MQLGTRWVLGGTPPSSLPDAVVAAIGDVEREVLAIDAPGFDPASWRWTLTYLENLPVVELDDGTVIRFDPATNAVKVTQPE